MYLIVNEASVAQKTSVVGLNLVRPMKNNQPDGATSEALPGHRRHRQASPKATWASEHRAEAERMGQKLAANGATLTIAHYNCGPVEPHEALCLLQIPKVIMDQFPKGLRMPKAVKYDVYMMDADSALNLVEPIHRFKRNYWEQMLKAEGVDGGGDDGGADEDDGKKRRRTGPSFSGNLARYFTGRGGGSSRTTGGSSSSSSSSSGGGVNNNAIDPVSGMRFGDDSVYLRMCWGYAAWGSTQLLAEMAKRHWGISQKFEHLNPDTKYDDVSDDIVIAAPNEYVDGGEDD